MQQDQLILPEGTTVRVPNGSHYVIEELLGRGGFGAVYLVHDRHVENHYLALKEVIDPSTSDRERFIYEAELLKRLQHKSLPRVYDVFENEKLKRVYMLMDYVKGRDLAVLLGEQPEQRFSLQLILAVMGPIVDALTYLHSQVPPIIHRDIKPANIIVPLRGEEAVLVDFGIAKEYVEGKTTSVIRHGSPGYAALEQYGQGGTSPRTDIYGLGATLYTLLTGVVPADPVKRIAESKGFDPLEPVSLLNHNIPGPVARTIQRAMSISVEERFNTAEEFWQELSAHATQPPDNVNTFKAEMATLKTPLPLAVTEQKLPRVKSGVLKERSSPTAAPPRGRRGALFAGVISLLLVLVLAGSLFYLGKQSDKGATTNKAPAAIVTTGGRVTPTPSPSPASVYPTFAPSYAGEIGDVLAQRSTPMYLQNMRQSQGNFSGFFRGLGLAGPLYGTVTAGGKLQFSVSVQGGSSTLAFTGYIKVGGDLAGSYNLLDQSGQQLGDYGPWYGSPGA